MHAAAAHAAHAATTSASASSTPGPADSVQQAAGTQGGSSTGAPAAASAKAPSKQTVDYTTLAACVAQLSAAWVPAKVEQVVMSGRTDLALRMRTLTGTAWLHLSWHPIAARMCVGGAPERGASSEAFTLGEQLHSALAGRVLICAELPVPWERVVRLAFGERPGNAPSHCVYAEVLGRYSNVLLTEEPGGIIAACATQVGTAKSSLRLLQTGRPYEPPPVTSGVPPDDASVLTLESWRSVVTRAAVMEADAATASAAAIAAAKTAARAGGAAAGGGGGAGNAPGGGGAEGGKSGSGGEGGGGGGAAAAAAAAGAGAPVAVWPRLVDGLTRAFQGVSPWLVEELCTSAGRAGDSSSSAVSPRNDPASLSDAQWAGLWGAWGRWLGALQDRRFDASLSPCGSRYSVLGGYAPSSGGTGTACADVFELLDRHYSALQGTELHSQLQARLASTVSGALKKAGGRVFAFRKQLADSTGADAVQMQADMITANLYRIRPGAAQVEVESWETGEAVTIALDPLKSAVEVTEGLYKRARKLRKAVAAVAPLLEVALEEVEYLGEIEASVSGLKEYREEDDLRALREVQDELVAGGYLKPLPDAALAEKGAAKGRKANKQADKRAEKQKGKAGGGGGGGGGGSDGFRSYTSPGGFQVLLGRNNTQNDQLSNRVAVPGDFWMHARGIPGSHAIIRVPAGRTPDDADVQFCADLTAYFSKARDSGKADVIVTLAQHLKKPRGAKPGQIMVIKELRNVVARPSRSEAAKAAVEAGGRGV